MINGISESGNGLYLNTDFLLNSNESWESDLKDRFNLEEVNTSFRESVPVLNFVDWKILRVERGYVETVLPINPNSSNQHITHQAALMLLSADYTGGLALATLFHKVPVIGFWPLKDDYGAYMWGAKSYIKWYYPSFNDLICKARIDTKDWHHIAKRFKDSKKVVTTVTIEMFNGDRLVAKSEFTYWVQDTKSLMKNAFDEKRIDILYEYKTKATARLIAGIRALEQELPENSRKFNDPYSKMLAGKHGMTLAKRFCHIIPQIQNMVSARTKYLDCTVLDFISNNKNFNVVNIGSGYDTRFWRFDVKDAKIFDLDLPVVLSERRRIFDYSKRSSMFSVPIDLREQEIGSVLKDNGNFDDSCPTIFIWEGGSMYFKSKEIDKIFSSISKIMSKNKNSVFWFDYVSEDIVYGTADSEEAKGFIRNMSKMGEAFVNGFRDIFSVMLKYGLKVKSDSSSDLYIKTNDIIYKHYRFCVAQKKIINGRTERKR